MLSSLGSMRVQGNVNVEVVSSNPEKFQQQWLVLTFMSPCRFIMKIYFITNDNLIIFILYHKCLYFIYKLD